MKKAVSFLLVLCIALLSCAALAEDTKTGVAYGVYALEGEHPDSAIRATVTCDETGKITSVSLDEALIPYAIGGAEGWALLSADQTANSVSVGDKLFAATFTLGGIEWTGAVNADGEFSYTAEVGGETVNFNAYVATMEGGAWYYGCYEEGATLSDGTIVPIGTKASIGHGAAFWPSDIKFPGNIANIEQYVVENGVSYGTYPENADIAKNADGVWTVCDVSTGATLAGTPNYLNIIKSAYDSIVK